MSIALSRPAVLSLPWMHCLDLVSAHGDRHGAQDNEAAQQEIAHWKSEAERLAGEIVECQQRLASFLARFSPHLTSYGTALAPLSPPAGLPGQATPQPLPEQSEKKRHSLSSRATELMNVCRGLEDSLQKMSGELGTATNAIGQLRGKLEAVEDEGSSKVREIKAQAKQERKVLVNAALSSMRQLRSHLTTALSGLREVPAPTSEEAKETMVCTADPCLELGLDSMPRSGLDLS